MTGFLLRAALSALGLWIASEIFSGLHFDSASKLLVSAVLLGIANAFVRPLAFILTLPITVLTLGLFLLVLNAAMVGLVAWIVPGFEIAGFSSADRTALVDGQGAGPGASAIVGNGRIEIYRGPR